MRLFCSTLSETAGIRVPVLCSAVSFGQAVYTLAPPPHTAKAIMLLKFVQVKTKSNDLYNRIRGNFCHAMSHCAPSNCLLCGMENSHLLCRDCTRQFFSASPNRCISCALPILIHDARCGNCLSDSPAFDATTVACDYGAPLDQLILALKFAHRLAVAPALAKLLAEATLSSPIKNNLPDFLIAVPLSRQRLAKRGFNQALEIARPFARYLGRPVYADLLQRIRDTEAQTLLHPDQRHENILNAFAPNSDYADRIRGRHIGVIDDVMTTGATLHEVASCLKQHGAARVSNMVFARTPPH